MRQEPITKTCFLPGQSYLFCVMVTWLHFISEVCVKASEREIGPIQTYMLRGEYSQHLGTIEIGEGVRS